MGKSKGIFCCICGNLIAKYQLDLGDTILLRIKRGWKYVCDDCSYTIALQRIKR